MKRWIVGVLIALFVLLPAFCAVVDAQEWCGVTVRILPMERVVSLDIGLSQVSREYRMPWTGAPGISSGLVSNELNSKGERLNFAR